MKNNLTDIASEIEEINQKMEKYRSNTMNNVEESIKLAVSHISHSVIAVQNPKQFDPEDVYERLNRKVENEIFFDELDTK